MTRKFLITATLLLSTATASADPAETIRGYAAQIDSIKSDLGRMNKDMSVAACQQASTVAGAPSNARAICTDYKKWRLLGEAYTIIAEGQKAIAWLKYVDLETNHAENGAELIAAAKACTDGIDRVIKEGVQTDYTITVRVMGTKAETTVGKAKAEICEPLAEKAKTFSDEVNKAKASREERTTKPYTDVGITGDRLEYLVHYYGYQWYGVGQVALNTPAALKKARVLFNSVEDSDRVVTLRRYEFKGDKLVKSTSQQYLLQPGPKAYR